MNFCYLHTFAVLCVCSLHVISCVSTSVHCSRWEAIKHFHAEHHEVLAFAGYLVFVLLYSLAVNENAGGEDFQRHNLAVKAVIAQSEWAYELSPVMRKVENFKRELYGQPEKKY